MKKKDDLLSTRVITGISACVGTVMLAIIIFSGKTIWDLNNRITKLEPDVKKISESVKTSDADLRRAENDRRRQEEQSINKWRKMSEIEKDTCKIKVDVSYLKGYRDGEKQASKR